MRQSKVFQILEHFNKIEQNRLRKYLQSPYFNKNQALVQLFELMVAEINQPSTRDWSREAIWPLLQPDQPYDDPRMRKYFSELLKHLEDFLILQEIEGSPVIRNIHLLQGIKRKKIQKLLNSTRKNIQATTEKITYRDTTFFLGQYLLEYYYDEMLTDIKDLKVEKTNLEAISQNLDYFYIGEKLRIYCDVLAKKRIANHAYHIELVDDVIQIAQQEAFAKIPTIKIYTSVYKTYVDPNNTEHYFELKNLLAEYSHLFPREEEKNLYELAQNYCIAQINKANSLFLNELFALYKIILQKDFLVIDGKLDSLKFRNIVTVGLRLGEYQWIESFIHDCIKYLPENTRANTFSYSLSQLYFYEKRYGEVIKLLQEIEYDDVVYNVNSKTTLMMTYYETGEFEPLASLLESFRVYLNRNKELPAERRTNYKNLIKFTKKLISLLPSDKKNLQQLKTEVLGTNNIPSRAWLLEKIEEYGL